MSFRSVLLTEVRRRRSLVRERSVSEMEERAARWAGTRKPLIAEDRNGERPALFATLAGASPAHDLTFDRIDPRRFSAAAAEAEIEGLVLITEPRFYKGNTDWIEAVRGETDAPLLRIDWLLDPPSVFEALADPVDAVALHTSLLGEGGLDETLAFLREQSVTGVLVIEDLKDVETVFAHQPPAVLIERLDPETLEPRKGFADRVCDLLGDYPGVRMIAGGLDSAGAVRAAAERPVQALVLSEWVGAAQDPLALLKELRAALDD